MSTSIEVPEVEWTPALFDRRCAGHTALVYEKSLDIAYSGNGNPPGATGAATQNSTVWWRYAESPWRKLETVVPIVPRTPGYQRAALLAGIVLAVTLNLIDLTEVAS